VQNENSTRVGSVEAGDESNSTSTSNHFLNPKILFFFSFYLKKEEEESGKLKKRNGTRNTLTLQK
jgi:hypothetical protein